MKVPCKEKTEKSNQIPFLRKVFLAEAEKIDLPSFELLPIILKKIRSFLVDK